MMRMRMRRTTAVAAACLTLGTAVAGCNDGGGGRLEPTVAAQPTAGTWKTWVLGSPTDVIVPPPPAEGSDQAEADLNVVKDLVAQRTPEVRSTVEKWNGPLPTKPWTETAFDFVSKAEKNPPLQSRNYALLHVAMYDAVVSAYHWKQVHRVDAPDVETLVAPGADPSYPSEHAAIAGAASRVLAHLYPTQSALRLDEMADEAAHSRVQAGTNTPSDVAAGLELGRGVADKVIARAKTDGAGTPWDGRRPPGIGRGPAFWEPPPGSTSPPVDPPAATWKGWVLTDNSRFRPPPPPAFGTAAFRAAAQDLVDVQKNLTQEQKDIAKFWEGPEGTKGPSGITLGVAMGDVEQAAATGDQATRWSIPRSARALALLTVAMADGGIAVWDAKFTYWNPRPENGVRDSGVDRNWKPFVPTPRFPAYPSGSAGYAGGAEAIMTYLFPDKAAEFKRRAEEQAVSRVYAGIHWRYDAVSLDGGRKIAGLVIDRAKADGADAAP